MKRAFGAGGGEVAGVSTSARRLLKPLEICRDGDLAARMGRVKWKDGVEHARNQMARGNEDLLQKPQAIRPNA